MADDYDPDLWDEESLHAALSALRIDPTSAWPRSELRYRLSRLLARPIDDQRIEIRGVEIVIPVRDELELARLPAHQLVVFLDELGDHRFAVVPETALTPELRAALEQAHGLTFGDPRLSEPETYPSLVRVVAGITEEADPQSFWAMWVMDWFDTPEDEVAPPLPSLVEVTGWMGVLRPFLAEHPSALDVHIAGLCVIYLS